MAVLRFFWRRFHHFLLPLTSSQSINLSISHGSEAQSYTRGGVLTKRDNIPSKSGHIWSIFVFREMAVMKGVFSKKLSRLVRTSALVYDWASRPCKVKRVMLCDEVNGRRKWWNFLETFWERPSARVLISKSAQIAHFRLEITFTSESSHFFVFTTQWPFATQNTHLPSEVSVYKELPDSCDNFPT